MVLPGRHGAADSRGEGEMPSRHRRWGLTRAVSSSAGSATQSGMKIASSPPIHANVPGSELEVLPPRQNARAASAVRVTGLILANPSSHAGMVSTGTNTELAKTSGKITTKPAD